MKVAEFIELLKTLPQDADVYVSVREELSWSTGSKYVPLEQGALDGFDFVDFTSNPFVGEDHPMRGKKVLYLGEDI